jgi:hypothetical protein
MNVSSNVSSNTLSGGKKMKKKLLLSWQGISHVDRILAACGGSENTDNRTYHYQRSCNGFPILQQSSPLKQHRSNGLFIILTSSLEGCSVA